MKQQRKELKRYFKKANSISEQPTSNKAKHQGAMAGQQNPLTSKVQWWGNNGRAIRPINQQGIVARCEQLGASNKATKVNNANNKAQLARCEQQGSENKATQAIRHKSESSRA